MNLPGPVFIIEFLFSLSMIIVPSGCWKCLFKNAFSSKNLNTQGVFCMSKYNINYNMISNYQEIRVL